MISHTAHHRADAYHISFSGFGILWNATENIKTKVVPELKIEAVFLKLLETLCSTKVKNTVQFSTRF